MNKLFKSIYVFVFAVPIVGTGLVLAVFTAVLSLNPVKAFKKWFMAIQDMLRDVLSEEYSLTGFLNPVNFESLKKHKKEVAES